ncbi:MAG: GNAT family N-acetyltransferase [Caldilineaceae bacterium]|nr:GNAT family N-acetyltransferase [Caldilineaceae bacterium]
MSISFDIIRTVEEISLNAWPANQTLVDEGWLLRFTGGYTRRANSVNPIYRVDENDAESVIARIDRCEQIYRRRNQPVIFKITPVVQPGNLDETLAQRGYALDAPTGVRLRSLTEFSPSDGNSNVEIHLEPNPSTTWIETFSDFSALTEGQQVALSSIVANIAPLAAFVTLREDGQALACGLAVLERQMIGLYDIVTAPAARGQGYGTQLLHALLAWGKTHGAQHAYLQVMNNNLPAQRLYDRLGFREIYQYWYRVKSGD